MMDNKVASSNAKIPSQNNISATINANIANLTDIVNIVVKAINTKGLIYNAKTLAVAKIYSAIVKTLFNENGAVVELCNAANVVAPLQTKKIKSQQIKSVINDMTDLNFYLVKKLMELNTYNSELDKNIDISSGIKVAVDNINNINNVLNTLPVIDRNRLVKKSMRNILYTTKAVYDLSVDINEFDTTVINDSNKKLEAIKVSYSELIKILNEFGALALPETKINTRSVKHTIGSITDIEKYIISKINELIYYNGEINSNIQVFNDVSKTLDVISSMNLNVPNAINTKLVKKHVNNILKTSELVYDLSAKLNTFDINTLTKKEVYIAIATAINNIASVCNDIINIQTVPNSKLKAQRRAIKRSTSNIVSIFNDINDMDIDADTINASNQKISAIKVSYSDIIAILNGFSTINVSKKQLNTKHVKKLITSILEFNNSLVDFINGLNEKQIKEIDGNKLITNVTSVLDSINKIYDSILNSPDRSIKLKLRCLTIKKDINRLIVFINSIETIKINDAILGSIKEKLATVTGVFEEIGKLFDLVSNVKTPKFLKLKLFFILKAIYKLITFSYLLSMLVQFTTIMVVAQVTLTRLYAVVNMLDMLFDTVNGIKVNIKTFIKIKLLYPFIMQLIHILRAINVLSEVINRNKSIKDTAQIFTVFAFIKQIFAAISDIPTLGMRRKLKKINRNIIMLGRIITAIDRLKIRPTVFVDIILINLIIGQLATIFTQIVLFSPIYLIGSIAIWAMVGAVFMLKIAIKLITKILNKIATDPTVLMGLLSLTLVLGLVTAIGVMLLVIALVATPIVKATVKILALFGIITLVAVMALGLGALIALASPYLAPAIAGLAMLAIVFVAVGVIAIILKGIELINLDSEKIKANVEVVLSTAKMIINSIFGNNKDPESKGSDKGFISSIIEFVGGSIVTILKSVLAVHFLAMTMVSIFIILLISIQLRLIQMLDLDQNKIITNVNIVINTALMVVDAIFNRGKDTESEGSKKSWIGSVIQKFGGTLFSIIKAIMSVYFLAASLVSITLILIMASQLRLLQNLDLDPAKIGANVNIVITTALNVVNAIFNQGKEKDDEGSKKSWIVSVIEMVGGTMLSIIKAIMSVYFLAISIVSISLILVISGQLKLLQNLDLDANKVTSSVNLVIDTALGITNALFNRKEEDSEGSKKSWLVSLIEFVGGPIIKIAQAIMAVQFLAMSIASIFLVTILAKQLKHIAEINLPEDISGKVNSIIVAANQVKVALFDRKDDTAGAKTDEKKKGFLGRIFSGLGGAIDMIASMAWLSTAFVAVGMVGKLAEQLTTILNVPDVGNITAKTEVVCNAADQIIKYMTTKPDIGDDITGNSRLDIIDKINFSINEVGNIKQSQIRTINKVFNDYSKFIDKVNSVDVTKLETSTQMFAQMANFSNSIQGNFEKLAEALNENLMPVLQELKEIMGAIPEKLDTGFQNTSASIAATTVTPTQEAVTAQVSRENPTMTKKEVDNIVQQRMKDYSRTEATGVVAKLDQLINLLKGYSGENVKVKTV